MNHLQRAEIGSTGLQVTRLGFGGLAIAGLYKKVSERQATATIRRSLELGINYFDTAPLYGYGISEQRLGRVLHSVLRNNYVLSTKVGRILGQVIPPEKSSIFRGVTQRKIIFDLSSEGVLRSVEDSMKRLKVGHIDILFIHDPDLFPDGPEVGYQHVMTNTYPTLADLRSRGIVKAIGVGMNQWQMLCRFANDADFDCFLLAGRYTLLDQSALTKLLPLCQEKRISICLGGPYNSGILASELTETPKFKFDYQDVSPKILKRAKRIKAVCDRYHVPLKAAALQFVLAHPVIATVISGAGSPENIHENFLLTQFHIPSGLWQELRRERLIPYEAPVPME